MDIGIGAPTGIPGASRNDVLEWARQAERRGFSSIAAGDRLNDSLDPLTSLAAIAAATERIKLMTAVLVVPRRASTAELAQQVATLHRLSDHRLVLGVGLGNPKDYRASDAPIAGQRQRTGDSIAAMQRIWSGVAGPKDSTMGPGLPDGGPEIIVGGHSAGALRRAAAYEGWLGGNATPDNFGQCAEKVHRAWRDAERPGSPRLVYFQYFGLGPDAASQTEQHLRRYYSGLPDAFIEYSIKLAAIGEEEIRRAVADYAAAGCDELLLIPTTTTNPAQVNLLADILPLG